MQKLAAFFYPPGFDAAGTDVQRRIRLAVNITLFFLGLLLVFQPLYLIELENGLAAAVGLPALGLFAGLLFLLRSGRIPFPVFANVLIGTTVIVHTFNICTTGGPTSIFIAGYIDIQIMAALLVSRRATYVWTGIILATPLTLGLLELQGVRFPYVEIDAASPLAQVLISVSITAGASLFVILLKSGLDATLLLLARRNEELAAAHAENIRMEKRAAELEQQRRIDALRSRIAQDLHDDIGSTLSAINIYSSVAEQQHGAQPLLRKISESSGKALEAMSDIVWSINHSEDNLEAFVSRMREHATALFDMQETVLHLDLATDFPEDLLPLSTRKDVYLIYKEALNNCAKYARADTVRVSLRQAGGGSVLDITDDGIGFDATAPETGNGLRNMAARAAAIGGEFRIRTEAGQGTHIRLWVRGLPD